MNKVTAQVKAFATREALFKIPLIPPAITFVILILIARFFVIIQIYKVHDWRLGHLLADTHMVDLETKEWNQKRKKKKIIIFYFGSKISANDYFVQKLKENHFYVHKRLGFVIYYLASFLNFLIRTTDENATDPDGLMLKNSAPIAFNQQEVETGREFLGHFGLNIDSKFVCLHVRDSAYLREEEKESKYQKHSTRNSNVGNYVALAECLAELGYTVFRMGSAVNQSLDSAHPQVIDYATNGMRTEFLDIFLGAHCTFAMVTNSGWSLVPRIFNRPTIFVNAVPFLTLNQITTKTVLYPKRVVDMSTHQPLDVKSLIRRGVVSQSNLFIIREMGLEYEELSAQDLVNAGIEMVSRVEMRFQQSEKSERFHADLIRELTNDPLSQFDSSKYPFRAEYASCFLEKYSGLNE